MIESQIRALFNQIADAEPGPSRVDIQLARRGGRARLRWRRACVAGTSVLATAAVAALAVAAGPARCWPARRRSRGAAPVQPADPERVVRLAARRRVAHIGSCPADGGLPGRGEPIKSPRMGARRLRTRAVPPHRLGQGPEMLRPGSA